MACNAGHRACGGTCKPESAASCGATCAVCNAAPLHGTARCNAGVCGFACDNGFLSEGGACVPAAVNDVLDIGAAVSVVTRRTIGLSNARMSSRPAAFASCPLAQTMTAGNYPYQYIVLRNPSAAKAAKVTVYLSVGPGGVIIDTIMAVYAGAVQPLDDNARKLCRDGVNDQSSDVALTGHADFSILKGVAIPAGGSVLAYISTFYAYEGGAEITTGNINLNTKVETLD